MKEKNFARSLCLLPSQTHVFSVTRHDLDVFQQMVHAEVALQVEQIKADFIGLLNREIEIRERKTRQLEAEIERLKRAHGK